MIKKLDSKMEFVEISILGNKKAECLDFEAGRKLNKKINELVDAVNQLVLCEQARTCYELIHKNKTPAENVLTMVDNQVTADLPNIDVGELAFLSKENTKLKDEIDRLEIKLERTRKALDVAVDALDRMAVHDSIYDIIARNAMKRIEELEQKDK